MEADEKHPVIEVKGLVRTFRGTEALKGVDLAVPEGCVYGLVGENGAGKTTLINHILGALRAQQGSVRVFGMDPVKDPVNVLAKVGYLSEERAIPGWMRVDELMRYTRAFYPKWDPELAEDLRDQFGLDPKQKIRHLSRGKLALAGLLIALAHRPPLLVLDEPSSGLDPVVRRDILGAIVRTVADEGRTVLFSSHLLDEVERASDYVAMIFRGEIVHKGRLDTIKAEHHRFEVRFGQDLDKAPTLDGALDIQGRGSEWTILCNGKSEEVRNQLTGMGATIVQDATPGLEDIFVAHAKPVKTRGV